MARSRSSFKMGTVEMLTLFLLNQRDLYGYEICTLLGELSDGAYVLAEGSLYPILYRILEKKYISDKEVMIGKRRIRVYYHIELLGKKRLADLLEDYNQTTDGIGKILSSSLLDKQEDRNDK